MRPLLLISFSFLALAFMVRAQGTAAAASEPNPPAKEDGKKEDIKPLAEGTALNTEKTFSSFGQMIPMGTKNRKVRIPSFEKGRATSLITADAMTRINDKELFAEDMVIESYAMNPKENLRVQLISATYDMEKKTLSSTQRSKVMREDFSIEGDSMIYDTTNASGKMVGRVIMIIKDPQAIKTGPTSAKQTVNSSPPSSAAAAKTRQ
jgi:hypothetical protein